MANDRLQHVVMEELSWDPKIDHTEIAVSVDDASVVTLQGTVGSPRERIEAERAAHRVRGVRKVRNELEVRILTREMRQDAELRGEILQALRLNSLVPDSIGATVEEGMVTLTGNAQALYQQDETEYVAASVRGVRAVNAKIAFDPAPDVSDIKLAIRDALLRDARFDADSVIVTNVNGTVILSRHVCSWAAHDTVVRADRTAGNVSKVIDHVAVEY